VAEELTKIKAENARLKALLYKTNIHNASPTSSVPASEKKYQRR
jgi:hypothetical protein